MMGLLNQRVDDWILSHVQETVDCIFDAIGEALDVHQLRLENNLEWDNLICEGAYHDVIFDLNSALDHLAVMINASGRPLPLKWAVLDKKIREKQLALEPQMVAATAWLKRD